MGIIGDARGGFTIETAIAFTMTFFSVCLVIYMGAIALDRASAQAAADYAAGAGSAGWFDGGDAALRRGLYLRTDIGGGARMEAAVVKIAEERYGASSLPGFGAFSATASYAQNPLNKTLSVSSKIVTTLPDGRPTGAFGLRNAFYSAPASRALIPDAPDLIRKLDLLYDVERVAEKNIEFLGKAGSAVRNATGKIRGFIDGLLKG